MTAITTRPLVSGSPAPSLSPGVPSESHLLALHYIAAASVNHQSPFCWTAPAHVQ